MSKRVNRNLLAAINDYSLLGKETWSARIEHLEALLFGRKPNKLHFGSNKQWGGFNDTYCIAMNFHCNRRTQAAIGNHTCSQGAIPGKAMKLSADDVKAHDEIIALDDAFLDGFNYASCPTIGCAIESSG
jgi:hypothetical protein